MALTLCLDSGVWAAVCTGFWETLGPALLCEGAAGGPGGPDSSRACNWCVCTGFPFCYPQLLESLSVWLCLPRV